MRAGRGVQAEVVASLAIIMVTATALLTAFLFRTQAAQVEAVQGLIGQALLAEARSPTYAVGMTTPGVEWWTLDPDGRVVHRGSAATDLDQESRELATEARTLGGYILRSGAPWDPVRFAVPMHGGARVAVARLPAVVSRGSVLVLLLLDSLVFAAFGAYLLRRRVVAPMRELAAAARTIGEAGPGARVAVEGVDEVCEVASAFNGMSEALEQRTGALEKAVADLREANAHLGQARVGLMRAERLAAVGSLAAGVAHEVGNPMGALLAYLELAGRDPGVGDPGRESLRRAGEQGERVRVILRQLLDFSRPPQARTGWVELSRVLEQMESLVHAQKRYEGIHFEIDCEPGVMPIRSDESIISQILLNLVINAAHAVADRPEPAIRLTLRSAHLRRRGSDGLDSGDTDRAADAVECWVEDNGPGVVESEQERIFDPFFTTKPPGEGTGLGLANAQRLAEELGGALEYRSSDSLGGAAFGLRLPREGEGSPPERDDAGVRALSRESRSP
jgi:two-component system NtrC family sensor kinase